MKQLTAIIACLFIIGACQNDSQSGQAVKNPDSIINLPPLPEERRQALFRNTISIDVIAYDMGVSLSYNNATSIQPVIGFIKPTQGVWKANCKPVGRISFMTTSGVGEEAEMLIHQGCKTFVWLDKGKQAFMNELTDEGNDFWNNFIPADGKVKLPENAQPIQK